jgi:hypothetical protein
MVEAAQAEHPRLIRLLNERVLHKMNGTYSTKDRAGERYELFTVDYGAFVRFRGTSRQVDEAVFLDSDADSHAADQLVPVDDKRSIRRIIFDPTDSSIRGHFREVAGDEDLSPLWKCARYGEIV